MGETKITSSEIQTKPRRLTWWLLLSVILSYGISFLRNIAMLVYGIVMFFVSAYSTKVNSV
jgi:hypothetical protein